MVITYLYNSGFCIELEKAIIVIDFYKDTQDTDGFIYKKILPQAKKLYVLATHSHLDHFNREILNWKRKREDITYIFFEDILNEGLASKDDAFYLAKLESWKDDSIFVKAYGSTDIGGSFYIEVEGKRIFHAGDLNNWHWNEEATAAEIKEAEDFYGRELADVANDIKVLNVAMFPIDPRLGKDLMKGAQQFIEAIDVDMLVPMHFGNKYDTIKQFKDVADGTNTKYWMITSKGDSIKC